MAEWTSRKTKPWLSTSWVLARNLARSGTRPHNLNGSLRQLNISGSKFPSKGFLQPRQPNPSVRYLDGPAMATTMLNMAGWNQAKVSLRLRQPSIFRITCPGLRCEVVPVPPRYPLYCLRRRENPAAVWSLKWSRYLDVPACSYDAPSPGRLHRTTCGPLTHLTLELINESYLQSRIHSSVKLVILARYVVAIHRVLMELFSRRRKDVRRTRKGFRLLLNAWIVKEWR